MQAVTGHEIWEKVQGLNAPTTVNDLTKRLQYRKAVPPFRCVAHLVKLITWSRWRER